jgi:hypothetical protein
MSKSDYLEQKFLDHLIGTAFTAPSTWYVALYTSAPSDSGGGTQVTIGSNAYARVSVAANGSNWTRTASSIANATAITFPAPSPNAWGTVTHFGVFDAASGGNLLFWAALTTPRATAAGVAPTFAIGALTHSED